MTLSRINHTGAAVSTTLSGSITALSTSATVASGSGYPTANFVIKIDAGTPSEEKILCSSRSGTTVNFTTRGYDGTTATSHSTGAAVEHSLASNVVDDLNDHVYTTTRDDHTQYARTDGTRAFSGAVTISSGGLTVSAGGAAITGAVSATSLTSTSTVQGTALTATLSGTNGRYVGSTNGAPVSGTFSTGDFADDPTSDCFWICTTGGTPGTWAQAGGATDAAWTTPALSNSWIAYNAANFSPGYRKVGGRVYLRGAMQSGTVGSAAFVLPTGYRPAKALAFACWCTNSPNTGDIAVDAAGNVVPVVATGAIFLDNISFDLLS